jgi:hypothetical protein
MNVWALPDSNNWNRRHDIDRLCVWQFVLDRGVNLHFRDLQLHLRQRALLAVMHHPHGRYHGRLMPPACILDGAPRPDTP